MKNFLKSIITVITSFFAVIFGAGVVSFGVWIFFLNPVFGIIYAILVLILIIIFIKNSKNKDAWFDFVSNFFPW